MTFQEFWPLYLRAHRLPGTRALHYFATVIGIGSTIETIVTQQVLIFVIGVPLGYCIAIGSHRFIEGNQALVRVNAVWGVLADLRMCWLAMTGRLDAHFAKHGVANPDQLPVDAMTGSYKSWFGGLAWRHTLTMVSAVGVVVALMDLYDLIEPMERLRYPVIQLGVPIAAFAAALIAAFRAEAAARHVPAAMAAAGAYTAPLLSRTEASLQRACVVLLLFGGAAFVLAEMIEHGL